VSILLSLCRAQMQTAAGSAREPTAARCWNGHACHKSPAS